MSRMLVIVLCLCATSACGSPPNLFPAPIDLRSAEPLPPGVREVRLQGTMGHLGETPLFVLREHRGRVDGVVLEWHWDFDALGYRPEDAARETSESRAAVARYHGCTTWERGFVPQGDTPAWYCRLTPPRGAPAWRTLLAAADRVLRRPVPDSPPAGPAGTASVGICDGGRHWEITERRGDSVQARASFRGAGHHCWPDTAEHWAINQAGWDVIELAGKAVPWRETSEVPGPGGAGSPSCRDDADTTLAGASCRGARRGSAGW